MDWPERPCPVANDWDKIRCALRRRPGREYLPPTWISKAEPKRKYSVWNKWLLRPAFRERDMQVRPKARKIWVCVWWFSLWMNVILKRRDKLTVDCYYPNKLNPNLISRYSNVITKTRFLQSSNAGLGGNKILFFAKADSQIRLFRKQK